MTLVSRHTWVAGISTAPRARAASLRGNRQLLSSSTGARHAGRASGSPTPPVCGMMAGDGHEASRVHPVGAGHGGVDGVRDRLRRPARSSQRQLDHPDQQAGSVRPEGDGVQSDPRARSGGVDADDRRRWSHEPLRLTAADLDRLPTVQPEQPPEMRAVLVGPRQLGGLPRAGAARAGAAEAGAPAGCASIAPTSTTTS